MKQIFLKATAFIWLFLVGFQDYAQVKQVSTVTLNLVPILKGNNTFSTAFNNAATGRNDVNAYLLCYLTTLIYPQYLAIVANNSSQAYVDRLHSDAVFFQSEYQKYTASLFTSPQYQFLNESFPTGYDPEAMVISTPQTIYVIFRGTDRVTTNAVHTPLYDWGEC